MTWSLSSFMTDNRCVYNTNIHFAGELMFPIFKQCSYAPDSSYLTLLICQLIQSLGGTVLQNLRSILMQGRRHADGLMGEGVVSQPFVNMNTSVQYRVVTGITRHNHTHLVALQNTRDKVST